MLTETLSFWKTKQIRSILARTPNQIASTSVNSQAHQFAGQIPKRSITPSLLRLLPDEQPPKEHKKALKQPYSVPKADIKIAHFPLSSPEARHVMSC